MAYELFTSWQDYHQGLVRLLPLARHRISLFDGRLEKLRLDKPESIELLGSFLATTPPTKDPMVRLLLRQASGLERSHPRLLRLLERYGHQFKIVELTPRLAHLKDCMLLIDGRHGLICFHEERARSKLLIDEPEALAPYAQRFESLWEEEGTPYSPRPAGL